MNKRLALQLAPLRQRWTKLAPRERRTLSFGGLALALLLVWQVFVEPPLARIDHWRERLPALQQQTRELDRLLGAATPRVAADSASLQRSLEAAGLKVRVDDATPGEWHLDVAQASGPALLDWLGQAPAEIGFEVASVHIERLADDPTQLPTDAVSAQIVLSAHVVNKDSP